jgi:hypothetical protein
MTTTKRYFVADEGTDLDNGWTIETACKIGTSKFWADAERQVGCDVQIDKAIEVNSDCEWIGRDICFR